MEIIPLGKRWFDEIADERVRQRAAASFAAIIAQLEGLRPFSLAVQRVIQLSREVESKMDDIVRIIESEPGLATKVLRTINSAAFALRQKCTSVRQGVVLLGMKQLSSLCVSLSIINIGVPKIGMPVREHAAVVAAVARRLAMSCGLPRDEAFLGGLLHDVGKLLLLQVDYERTYAKLLRECQGVMDGCHPREREELGFDHAVLGAQILDQWHIPDPIPVLVGLHHHATIDESYAESPGIGKLVELVRLADGISYMLDSGDSTKLEELTHSLPQTGLTAERVQGMWGELHALAQEGRGALRSG